MKLTVDDDYTKGELVHETKYNTQTYFRSVIEDEKIIGSLEEHGMEVMREIQYKSYDRIVNGFNTIIQSNTGSGKTLAYLLPLLVGKKRGVIVAPTYELSNQIFSVAKLFAPSVGIHAGRLSIDPEADILICTPGKYKEMSYVNRFFCCIDEADVILENNLLINNIFEQFILVSATMCKGKALGLFLNRYCHLLKQNEKEKVSREDIRVIDLYSHGNELFYSKEVSRKFIFYKIESQEFQNISQFFLNVNYSQKLLIFVELLKKYKNKKIVVFFNTINSVIFYYNLLKRFNFNLISIFGKLNQQKRQKLVTSFDEMGGILFCTDLLARGFDFKSAEIVIHFESGFTLNTYVHRRGRAGRNIKGKSIIFLSNTELKFIEEITDLKELVYSDGKFLRHHGSSRDKKQNIYEGKMKAKILKTVENDFLLHRMAIDALKSFIKIYEGCSNHIFDGDALKLKEIVLTFGLRNIPSLDFVVRL